MKSKMLPAIYKRAASGHIVVWQAEIEGGKYRTIHGRHGGMLQCSDWVVCEAKNPGKKNYRSPEDQALFEVEAEYTKKLDKDYYDTLHGAELGEPKNFLPMLAYEYHKENSLPYLTGVYSQPKLDGIRCVARVNGLWTRNGKRIYACDHISQYLESYFSHFPDRVLDGELYNHQLKDDFNEIASVVKKQKISPAQAKRAASLIEFHIYDIFDDLYPKKTFVERLERLESFAERRVLGPLKVVRTAHIQHKDMLDEVYERYLADGYEGQMIRLDAPYVNKRTKHLLKRKEFKTEEYELVDIEPGLGNWAGKAKRAVLRLPNGKTFGAGIAGTSKFCAEVLKNKSKYIGKQTTVRFQNLTPDGVPRFPVVKELDRMDV